MRAKDAGGTLFLEQLDQLLLLCQQRIDLRCFSVQEVYDEALLLSRRKRDSRVCDPIKFKALYSRPAGA